MREGGGQWEKQEPDSLERVRLQIMLPGGYLVEGISKEAARQAAAVKEEEKAEQLPDAEPVREQERAELMGEQSAFAESAAESAAPRQESAAIVKLAAEPTATEPIVPERSASVTSIVRAPEQQNAAEPSVLQPEPPKVERIVVQKQSGRVIGDVAEQTQKPLMADALVIEGLKEDKWEQILDTYDNIHPYGDERVYVKLEPKDFIIMSGKYQHLVNNSFLLHGFYNYRHVILGKEGEVYYMGVPGVFYEREKMVALMFGFEAFECESGESKTGEFGYYLRKVEL